MNNTEFFNKDDIVKVVLPIASDSYDYFIPEDNLYKIGSLVNVNFKNKNQIGVILNKTTEEITYDKIKIKFILKEIKNYTFSQSHLNFINKVANYTLSPIGCVMQMSICFNKLEDYEKETKEVNYDLNYISPSLSNEQITAVNQLVKNLFNGFSVSVLDGVTGSGKTEVYFNVVNKVLEKSDSQVLILLPEIALTGQFIVKFKNRFQIDPILWHSSISKAQKLNNWKAIINGDARVIVGTRSALFLPYKNLSLIVLDEEHDSSYKQETGVIYQARDMAVLKASIEKIPIILASATPSIETIYNVNSGKYLSVKINSRFGGSIIPKIELIDMKKDSPKKESWGKSWISPVLIKKIEDKLENKEQVMLYINRRGYAPLILCNKCGNKLECPNCKVYLVAHNKDSTICRCHHCGYSKQLPNICKKCNETNTWTLCGPGIERIKEEVEIRFPNSKLAILSSDIITSQKRLNSIIDEITNQNIDIIIGTQIVVKGHHFPNLTLVGVIDGDMSLSSADLRANENTFQLLTQVSGRAGRDIKEGIVMIQTYNPDNSVMQAIKNNNRDAFIKQELVDRKNLSMPPFSKLTALIISSKFKEKVNFVCEQLRVRIPNINNIVFYGPIDSPLSYIQNHYRKRFLIVSDKQIKIQNIVKNWLSMISIPSGVSVKVDIDPYNFM